MTDEAAPITLLQLMRLFLRDAAAYPGLTDDTECSFGWWQRAPGAIHQVFNPRLKVTLGELRRAAEAPVAGEYEAGAE